MSESTATTDRPRSVDLHAVTKWYGRRVHALDGVSLRVGRGEIFGLLGPNGAGKSTLVKIIMTLVRPTAASGSILGQPVGDRDTLGRIGYLPEHPRLPWYLTGRQVVEFMGGLYGLEPRMCQRRAGELLEQVSMTDAADTRVTRYSKGMLQRVALAQALIADPELVLLDEPTDGVDPVGRREIRELLTGLRQAGKTVFLNSHQLGELEMVCDRVAILNRGQLAAEGTMDELALGRGYYEIAYSGTASPQGWPVSWDAPGPGEGQGKGRLQDGVAVELEGSTLRLRTQEAADVQCLVDALRQQGLVIETVRPVRPSLEDLFIETLNSDGQRGAAHAGGPAQEAKR